MTIPRIPLRYWIPGVLALLAIVLTTFALVHDWLHSNRAVEEMSLRRVTALGNVTTPNLEHYLSRDEASSAADELARLAVVPNLMRAMVMDNSDRVLFAKDFRLRNQPLSKTPESAAAPLVARARETKSAQTEITADRATLRAAFPFPMGLLPGELRPSRTAVFYATLDLGSQRRAEMAGILQRSLGMGAAAFLVCLGVWAYFHGTFTRRLNQMVRSVALFSSGNEALRMPGEGRDELGLIAKAVNQMVSDLSAQHAARRESEARFGVVADSAPVMIWMSGLDKLCTYFNKPWLDFSGRTAEQESGNGWADGVHPTDLARCLEIYAQGFDARQPFVREYRLRRRDGEYRVIEDHGVPRFATDGRFAGYIGSCADITERRRTEQTLAEERQWFRHLFEHSPVATWLEDYTALGTWMEQLRAQGVADLRAFLEEHPGQLRQAVGLIRVLDVNPAAIRQNAAHSKTELQTALPQLFDAATDRSFVDQLDAIWHGQVSIDLESSSRRLDGRPLRLILHVEIPRRGEAMDLSRVILTGTDITERKQAEEALDRERTLLRTVIDLLPDYIYVKDTQSRFLLANNAVAGVMRVGKPENMIGKSDKDFYPTEESGVFISDEHAVLAGHPLLNKEEPVTHPDGSRRFILTTKVPLKDAAGKIIGLVGFGRDFTLRKQVEETVQTSQRMLQLILDNIPQGVFWKDRESRYLGCNSTVLRHRGVENADSLTGKTDRDFASLTPEQAESFIRKDREVMASGKPQLGIIEQATRADGSMRWLETNKVPLHDTAGNVIGVLGTWQDITERKQAEEALRAGNKRYGIQRTALTELTRNRVSQGGDLSVALGEITETVARTLGVERVSVWRFNTARTAILCEDLFELSSARHSSGPEFKASDYPAYFRALATKDFVSADDARRDPRTAEFTENYFKPLGITAMMDAPIQQDGVLIGVLRHEHVGAAREWIPDEQTFAVSATNLVSLVLAESERRRVEEQLRQSQKMEAIGQLAGGVAHDFNNILTALMLQTDMARRHQGEPQRALELLDDIQLSAERAANLTRQLLAFSRRQIMQLRVLDVNETVTSLARMLQRILGEDIHLQLNLHPTRLIAKADGGMLEQVLMNLAVNARDAMPEGGRLIIETAAHVFTESAARSIAGASPGPYVCLRVGDTGCGIPPENLPHIFEPFFTTKEVGKGTGLGLATVFGIVRQHGGAVTVDSEVGAGTTFQILLPACSDAPSEKEVAPAPPRGGTETILVVEDDAVVRRLTCTVLELHGYEILEATNGVEALRVWDQHGGRVHLLFTDMVMPEGTNGRQLAAQLQGQHPQLKVIFSSGYSAEFSGRDVTLEEGMNFLQKPCPLPKLLDTVRRCLDS